MSDLEKLLREEAEHAEQNKDATPRTSQLRDEQLGGNHRTCHAIPIPRSATASGVCRS